jgi:hypothetical protein
MQLPLMHRPLLRLCVAGLLVGGCRPAASPPEPAAPVQVQVQVAPSAPAARAPAATLTAALDTRLLLPNANSVAVLDGESLSRFGLNDLVALALTETFDMDLSAVVERCGLDVSRGWLRRVILSSEMFGGPAAVVETRSSPEPLLDCIAQHVPDARAEQLGDRAAIQVKGELITAHDGKLLFGRRSALLRLLRLEDPSAGEPSDALLDQFGGRVDVHDTLARLELSSDTIVTAALFQPFGMGPRTGASLTVRDRGDGSLGLALEIELPDGGAAQLGLEGEPDQVLLKALAEMPAAIETLLGPGPEAARIADIAQSLRIEREAERLRLALVVPDAAPLVTKLIAALSAKRAAERAELEHLKKNISP